MTEQTTKTVTLEQPIKRGDDEVTEITLRKPNTGALRGLMLSNILQIDVDSMVKLLPRISTPSLSQKELYDLQPSDFTQLALEAAGFLAPKEVIESYQSE